MGLGSFRCRIAFIFCIAFLLWHSARVWLPLTQEAFKSQQVKQDAAMIHINPQKIKVQKVLITVYYEALCPDSRSFFLRHLLPTFQRIEENVIVELIPFGKAKAIDTPNGYMFTCQHGPTECEANMIHACSIDIIKNSSLQLNYISCMIKRNVQPLNIMKWCASEMQVDINSILKCYEGEQGKNLLAKYGKMTDALRPKLTFVPTIALDKHVDNQAAILKNLLQQVCLRLKVPPEGCQ